MKWIAAFLVLPAFAQDADIFEKKVRPLFAAKCAACHGAKVKMGGLDLSSSASIASVVTKNEPEQSRLYHALQYTEKVKMPPSGSQGRDRAR
ncbi:MAG: c-type cytochrome domain-containing protein [Bryobacteraceae bacterium]